MAWLEDIHDLVVWGGLLAVSNAHWSGMVVLVGAVLLRGAWRQEEEGP